MLNIYIALSQDQEIKNAITNSNSLELAYDHKEDLIILTNNGKYVASYWDPCLESTKRFIMEEIILLNLPDDVAPSF